MDNCFFCEQAPADLSCKVEQPIYRLRRYAHQGLVRRFEYDKLIIPVQRCGKCATLHAAATRRRKTAIAIGAVSGFIFGVAIPGAFLFTAIIGGFLGYVVAVRRAGKRYRRLRVKPLAPAAMKALPLIARYLETGWTLKTR